MQGVSHVDQYVPSISGENPWTEVRDYIEACLRRDLVGPSWMGGTFDPDEGEELHLGDRSSPDRFYLTGYLTPVMEEDEDESESVRDVLDAPVSEDDLPPEMQITEELGDTDEVHDERKSDSTRVGKESFSTRSIGITVSPSEFDWSMDVSFSWGEYTVNEEGEKRSWKRNPKSIRFSISESDFEESKEHSRRFDEHQGVLVYLKFVPGSPRTLTVRLVNERTFTRKDWKVRAESTMFQVRVEVNGGLREVRAREIILRDPSVALLYHDSEVLAQGHNIGVDWSEDGNRAWTDHIPRYEVPKMIERQEVGELIPSFEKLIDEESLPETLEELKEFPKAYKKWLEGEERRYAELGLEGPTPDTILSFEETFKVHTNNVKENISRIESGIDLLISDQVAREAFRLANEAILFSQTSETLSETYRIPGFTWRPFQLAFQLLNIPSIVNPEGDGRKIVDLAWFPTGGGKTEAYLGLIAFLSFYRRLNPESSQKEKESPGVHTIMRYTLRLLTSDQAGRLVRAVGAMNTVAERSGIGIQQGFSPFRVGNWVGEKSTPNRFFVHPEFRSEGSKRAQAILDKANANEELGDCSVVQFQTCPWCGDDSIGDARRYQIEHLHWTGGKPTLSVNCSNHDCEFHDWMPFTCVDEDIYLNPPTVLLGTADKFVQIANNHWPKSLKHSTDYEEYYSEEFSIRRMLGFERETGGPDPPDLIIQDELHLLSGPLGTIAGLVETALSVVWKEACGHEPKYVAATATIRGAERDVGLMYGKKLNVFPPPLLSASDNFFSEGAPVSKENPGRLHLGLMCSSAKSRSLTDQPSASILQSVNNLLEKELASGSELKDSPLDPYWTLVMYYNSLRELGSGQSSLSQNIPRWVETYSKSSGFEQRTFSRDRELTSRRSGRELTQYRSELNMKLGSQLKPLDVLSTSNMFQVGIDVPRLGIMEIIGQPRSNSEYIQSSGRIGRKKPGMVLSLLRGSFPRDQSHYELVRSFHQEFYRHVDRTSTTPFSLRSLDRALDTTLMALVRLVSQDLAPRDSLNKLSTGNRRIVRLPIGNAIQGFRDSIEGRLKGAGYDKDRYLDEVLREFDKAWSELQRWVEMNHESHKCCWTRRNDSDKKTDEKSWSRGSDDENHDGRLVISSLRDVADEIPVARRYGIHKNRFGFHKKSFFAIQT